MDTMMITDIFMKKEQTIQSSFTRIKLCHRGRSRIRRRRERRPSGWVGLGVPTYDFVKISKKTAWN